MVNGIITPSQDTINTMLTELTSKISLINYRGTQNIDLNNLVDGNMYIIRPSYCTNIPASLSGATSLAYTTGIQQGDEAIQFLFSAASNKMFFRRRYGAWQNWISIDFA